MEELTFTDTRSLSPRALLFDQSNRLDQHKANFESLKREYLKLQEMYDKLKEENIAQHDSLTGIVCKSENIIRQLQDERDEKIIECEQLRSQVMSPDKVMKFKNKIATEMEDIYRQHLESLEMEIQVKDSDLVKLKRTYDFLKQEYENQLITNEARIKEMNQERTSLIMSYDEQLKDLSKRLKKDVPAEIHKMRQLQRDNTQLNERVKLLLKENKEIKDELNAIGSSKDEKLLMMEQRLRESEGVNERLTSEKDGMINQVKKLARDLEESEIEQRSLLEKLHKMERDQIDSQRVHDNTAHNHLVEIDELKSKHFNEIQSIKEEKNKCVKEMNQYKLQMDTLQESIKLLELSLDEKTQLLAEAKESRANSEWERQLLIEKEKGELEQQISNIQSELLTKCQEYENKLTILQDKVTSIETDKSSVENECVMLQKELEQKNEHITQQNKDLKGLKDIKKTLGGVTIERNNLDNSCRQLEDELMKVKEQLQLMEKQRNIALGEVKTLQVNHECEVKRISNELERVKEKTMQEKDELSLRLREMEEKSGGLKKKYKRMKKLHQTSLDEVKRLIDEATTHENQLLQEKDQLRRLAEDDHKKMTKKVQTYQKRHQQFIMLLTSSHPLHHHLHDNDNDHIISDDDINVTN